MSVGITRSRHCTVEVLLLAPFQFDHSFTSKMGTTLIIIKISLLLIASDNAMNSAASVRERARTDWNGKKFKEESSSGILVKTENYPFLP